MGRIHKHGIIINPERIQYIWINGEILYSAFHNNFSPQTPVNPATICLLTHCLHSAEYTLNPKSF